MSGTTALARRLTSRARAGLALFAAASVTALGLAGPGMARAATPRVPAAPGDLTYRGCTGLPAGCAATSIAGALDGVGGVAVTPGGTDLYAASAIGSDVSHFRIGSAGNLIFAGCTGNLRKCTATTPKNVLKGAFGVAVTTSALPQVYVTSSSGDAHSHFRIGKAGKLVFAGCFGARAGCTHITPHVLDNAEGLAVTSNGARLYVGSLFGDAISRFTIARRS